MATNSDLISALERAAGHSLMGSVKGACHAHAPRASVSCERHVASRKRHLVPKASRERHPTVMRASHAGRMASAGPAGCHFCQGEPRLATIMGMGRKDKGREI